MEVNQRLAAAEQAVAAKAEVEDEVVALIKNLEEAASKEEEELAKIKDQQKLMKEALDAVKVQLDAFITAHLDDEKKKRTELDSAQQQSAGQRQSLEAELILKREALVASNKSLVTLSLFFFLVLMGFFLWCIWASMQKLPLAVVSRIDSAHMYPEEEMSMAWMVMDEFGWFGD